MLQGNKKRIVQEILSYFIDTTGLTEDYFILTVQQKSKFPLDTLTYPEWLAVKSFKLIQEQGLNLGDCLEFRNLTKQLKLEKQGMNISPLWKKEFANELLPYIDSDTTLLEISDLNSEFLYCGIPKERINTLGKADADHNFFNTFDFDSYNTYFLDLLPLGVREAILHNTKLFININPFLEHDKNIEALIEDMKLYGHSKKKVLNIFYGSFFRILRICQDYNLTNVTLGIFSPLNMFYEEPEYASLYSDFCSLFEFRRGVCFSPKSVGVKDKADLLGYSVWGHKCRKSLVPVVLEERVQHTEDTILHGTKRLLRGNRESLFNWCKNSVSYFGEQDVVPKYLNMQTKSTETVVRYENVLGYLFNSNNLLHSLKKVGVTSLPMSENTEVTLENLYKSVASFCVRSCLVDKIELNPLYLSVPDLEVEGYQEWLADAMALFLYGDTSMTKSYREAGLTLANRLFPLSFFEIRKYVKDENIINDINTVNAENTAFLAKLREVEPFMSDVGVTFYTFCRKKVRESLTGTIREDAKYKNSLVAWDASFYQIRGISSLFPIKEEEKYQYLLSMLKDKLSEGIYKYGFVSTD